MLSLQLVRDNPEIVRQALADRYTSAPLDEIIALDDRRRKLLQESETLKARRNEVSKQIGRMKDKPPAIMAEMREVGDRVRDLDAGITAVEGELNALLLQIPNIPHSTVPVGKDETENVIIRRWGEPRKFDFAPRPHWEIGEQLGIIDFARGVKISGARFYVLKGLGAKLERAIINFMIDVHTSEHGFIDVAPPYLVNRDSMIGTGQVPTKEDDMYRCDADDLFLIPTAEVPVTNLHRDEILSAADLPIYYVSYTACFRREAGAAGRDTRGMIRVHQFDKVEMVKFVAPDTSYDELEKLLAAAETIIQRLNLPYQLNLLCTGDLGFTSTKTYDPEVWFPGQGRYVEISSCSNFEAFQSRRANIRYRAAPGARPEYVHTLNGSGLAVGRTFAAILENYQQADGSVVVPEVLRPFMGVEVIK
ncbi:MAG: serine--tRNA ligase [Dehalococcoidia bacterium]|nr:serine--tRNA ligase [Dehalococcoidia bacterium]